MNQDLEKYYDQRAAEYDKVYAIPEEQEDLRSSSLLFQDLLRNKNVLEIACGTGYWTSEISRTAQSLLATDINESVLTIAKQRKYFCPVQFQVASMKKLQVENKFDAFFGGFIWSHLLLQELDDLLLCWSRLLKPHSKLIFIDSNSIRGGVHDERKVLEQDAFGNTFQLRKLLDGSEHKVLKNFPTADFLRMKLNRIGTHVEVIHLQNYWIAYAETTGMQD